MSMHTIQCTVLYGGKLYIAGTLQSNLDLCIPRKRIARPQSRERSLYPTQSTYFPAAELAYRSGEYIKRPQKHECRN
jgi:hypothetical protein